MFIVVAVTAGQSIEAQELEPRTYANLPVGLNFLLLGYVYTWGDVLLDPVIPLENVEAQIHGTFLAYVRALGVAGRSGKFQFVLPYAWLSARGDLEGETRSREVSGFADPALEFSIDLIGAPALSAEEFANYHQDLNIGVSFLLRPPLGQYDSDKLANIGTNRWAFRTEVGLSKALGRWILESSLAATVFTDNKRFLVDRVRTQAPVYALQLHAVYNLPSEAWVALDGTYYEGGEISTTHGEEVIRLVGIRTSRVGTTLSFPLDRKNSLRLHGSTSVTTRTRNKFNVVSITWQYRWGAGL